MILALIISVLIERAFHLTLGQALTIGATLVWIAYRTEK